jgi:hypothetical protein
MIDFLNESLEGPCPLNQQTLARNKIIDYIKDFILLFPRQSDYLQRGFLDKETQGEINNLMTSSFQVLISILEGNSEEEGPRAQLCHTLSDIRFLKKRLIFEYTHYVTDVLKISPNESPSNVSARILEEKLFDDNILDAFNIYILLKTLGDSNDRIKHNLLKEDVD